MKTKIIVLIVLIAVLHVSAEIRFVSKTGSNTAPYKSWATAADSIQKAIDLCNAGDTVVVANGIYKESLVISKVLTLLGTCMDSTIIDCRNVYGKKEKWTSLLLEDTTAIKNFTIYGIDYGTYQDSTVIIKSFYKSAIIENCRLKNVKFAISGLGNDFYLDNLIFENISGTNITAHYMDSEGVTVTNKCLFVQSGRDIYSGNSGSHIYTNNIYYPKDVTNQKEGIYIYFANQIIYSNNLSVGMYLGLSVGYCDFAQINNNVFVNSDFYNISLYLIKKYEIKNNIFSTGRSTSVNIAGNSSGIADYNIFWNNQKDINNYALLGKHNIFADPMFVADSSAINGRGDHHLQKYSPAIDNGDPDIKDIDGSRSDIGMFGGPNGESYLYKDLAPRTPINLQIEVLNKQLKLKWNKNSESDFSFYSVYRDTVKNFKADSSKKIAEITDTMFSDSVPKTNVYYKLTAVDKQGNESPLSEEAGYLITGVEKGKVLINDYALYQNYPNPFNPRTKIGYKLKENGKVRMTIYDIQGKLVETILNNAERTAGYHEEEFPIEKTNPLASGIYISRIEILNAGGIPVFSDSIKMLYLK